MAIRAVTGALALDDGVGRERRAVDEEVDLARSDADLRQQLERTRDRRLIRGLGCGQHFAGPALRACLDYDVGEGATDIDGEALVRGRTDHGRNISGRGEGRSRG